MSQQAPIYRNGRFHHHVDLKIARECASLRARPDGGFDELSRQSVPDDRLPLAHGNLLPFSRLKNYGDKLHYETAMAGDGNWIDGYTARKEIRVSSRSLFSNQVLPAARIEARV